MDAKLTIETMSVKDVIKGKAKYNPREITKEAKEALRQSLERYGYVDSLVFNIRTGTLVSGHQRIDILNEEGVENVDVSIIDVDEIREKELNVLLNNQEISGGYTTKLQELIEEFDIDFLDTFYIEDLLPNVEEELAEEKEQEKNDEQPFPKMELLPYESYDSVLLICKTTVDFNYIRDILKLGKVNHSTTTKKSKIGLTRAVDVKHIIKVIEDLKNGKS